MEKHIFLIEQPADEIGRKLLKSFSPPLDVKLLKLATVFRVSEFSEDRKFTIFLRSLAEETKPLKSLFKVRSIAKSDRIIDGNWAQARQEVTAASSQVKNSR